MSAWGTKWHFTAPHGICNTLNINHSTIRSFHLTIDQTNKYPFEPWFHYFRGWDFKWAYYIRRVATFGIYQRSQFSDVTFGAGGGHYFRKFTVFCILERIVFERDIIIGITYLLFYINVTFLFSSVPEGHGPILVLVIIFVLFLVIMGIAAVFVYRRWKKKSSKNGYNTPDEEVPMNPITAQPTETVS